MGLEQQNPQVSLGFFNLHRNEGMKTRNIGHIEMALMYAKILQHQGHEVDCLELNFLAGRFEKYIDLVSEMKERGEEASSNYRMMLLHCELGEWEHAMREHIDFRDSKQTEEYEGVVNEMGLQLAATNYQKVYELQRELEPEVNEGFILDETIIALTRNGEAEELQAYTDSEHCDPSLFPIAALYQGNVFPLLEHSATYQKATWIPAELQSFLAIAHISLGHKETGVHFAKKIIQEHSRSPKHIVDKIPAIRAERILERMGTPAISSIEDEVLRHPETGKSNPYNKTQLNNIFRHDPVNFL